MALKLLKELKSGVKAEYWKLVEIKQREDRIDVFFVPYLNQESRDAGKTPVKGNDFQYSFRPDVITEEVGDKDGKITKEATGEIIWNFDETTLKKSDNSLMKQVYIESKKLDYFLSATDV